MPEGVNARPMIMAPIWMVHKGATAEIAARATDVVSGVKTPIRAAAVAPTEKETYCSAISGSTGG